MVLIGGQKVDAAAIDRDPVGLLPGGAILASYLDARAMFASHLGPDVERLIGSLLPLGAESNFVASRDVTHLHGGLYAMQGADFCVVVQGTFDPPAIARAADAHAVTLAGAPLVKTRYAERDLYTAGNVGFVVLTQHTVVTGNETGMRRALDRLRAGKLERAVPRWMAELVGTPGAAFAVAGDVSEQPAVGAASGQLPFLAGLHTVRVLGNFKPPGLNFAGALTYGDPQAAASGAASLGHLQQVAQLVSMLSSWGLGGPLPPMQVAQQQSDVAFTLPVDEGLVRTLLRLGGEVARNALAPRAGAWPQSR